MKWASLLPIDVDDGSLKQSSKQLSLARKKIHFYLVWADLLDNSRHCVDLAKIVRLEYGT